MISQVGRLDVDDGVWVVIHFLKRFVNRRRPSICRLSGWPRGGAADRYVSAAANKKIHQVGRRECDAERGEKFRRQNVTLRQGGIVAPPAAGSNGLSRNGAADHAPAKTPHTHTQSSFHHFAASGHFWSTESLGRSLKMREKNGASSGAATLIRT